MRKAAFTLFALLFTAAAVQAGSLKVQKDLVRVSPPDANGVVMVSGPPGTLIGPQPIQIVVRNKESEERVPGTANPDGSFAIPIGADMDTKIKVYFTAADGDDTSKTVRVPVAGSGVVVAPVNTPTAPGTPPRGAAAAGRQLPPLKGPKKIVAVATFENKTNYRGQYRVSQGLTEKMTDALMRTDHFVVVERENLDKVFAEQDLAQSGRMAASRSAEVGKALTAQILIKGAVTEFDVVEEARGGKHTIPVPYVGGVPVDMSSQASRVSLGVIIYLIDSATGEVIESQLCRGQAVGKGESKSVFGFGKKVMRAAPVDRAVQTAIDAATFFITDRLARIPWQSRIIQVDGGEIYVKGGKDLGIKPGMELSVFRKTKEIRDPDTGELLGSKTKEIGRVVIESADKKFSIAKPSRGTAFQPGDLVRLTPGA